MGKFAGVDLNRKRPERVAVTNLQLSLRGDKLIIRGPVYNRELCLRMLKMAMQAIGDGMPAQTDAGPGGQRLLLPVGARMSDLYLNGKKKIG